MATRYDATLAQIALAWVMSKGEDIVPIPGARKIAHLRDNAGAANITLAPEDILTIEHIFTADNVTGLRYTQGDFDLIENNPLRAADGYYLRDVVTFAEQLLVR